MSAGEKKRGAYIAAVFAVVIVALVLACITCYLRRPKGPVRPARPVRPSRDGVEFDLSDLFGARDLELGAVRPGRARLPDPDMFVIPEVDEGGKSNVAGANYGKRGRQVVRHGVLAPHRGGAVLVHGDEDGETVLIPAGAPMGKNSKRESKGKGKAREIDDDDNSSSSSEPFGLSRYLSPRAGPQAPKSDADSLVFAGILPAKPKPAMSRVSCGLSVSRRPAYTGSSTIPGPSRFVVIDSDVSSEEEDVQRWRPAPAKVSRYRGLSATRHSQKPCAPSTEVATFQRSAESAPLPAPETFYFGSKHDSWEDFASDSEADTYNPDDWTSEVFSTVTGAQPAETTVQTNTDSDNNNSNNKTETETGKDVSDSTGEQYPVWEHGGPFVPDSRILEQKASLAGRVAKFAEVDVDGSVIEAPDGTSDVFKECLELLREGARSPTLFTSLDYDEEEKARPVMGRGKTWGMSGALFKRRRDQDGDAGEGPSRPQAAARSKTSQV